MGVGEGGCMCGCMCECSKWEKIVVISRKEEGYLNQMNRIEPCLFLFDFCCWWTSWQDSACQVWEDYTSPLTLFKLELLHPPSLCSLKGLNRLQMRGCVFVKFHCFYILSNAIYPTFHQRHSKLLTIMFNRKNMSTILMWKACFLPPVTLSSHDSEGGAAEPGGRQHGGLRTSWYF